VVIGKKCLGGVENQWLLVGAVLSPNDIDINYQHPEFLDESLIEFYPTESPWNDGILLRNRALPDIKGSRKLQESDGYR
jgi:hypothetical protein